MDWDDYRRNFEQLAHQQGQPASFVTKSLAYAEPLVKAGLPIIYDFSHLCELLGFDELALRAALQESASLYVSYFIPKRAAGYRQIHEPVPSLRQIQDWIKDRILNKCRPHDAATAFFRGHSIKQNAEPHLAQPMVLSLDVRDFFPSIGGAHVMAFFRSLGYAEDVASALKDLTVLNHGLPQGAPTSPGLSNLVMVKADERLSRYATSLSIRYSRYADDMTFSGWFKPGRVIDTVRKVLGDNNLALNEAKTRLMLPHERQEVTGVVVNQRLQAPRKLRRTLRQEVHFIERFGLAGHENRRPSLCEDRLNQLRGIAEFILFLNHKDRDARKAVHVLQSARTTTLVSSSTKQQ
ncbi:reverse transcriptase family protein [Sorangium sp. So ce385]|uniref:reverse transcriptase family protein n=1 Tax=Sorangium sp. So ce385 TaxID=3133308 RepID=UPI003F5C902B